MPLVTWDETYSVRIKRLDEQHQKLFALLNALHDAMRQGRGQTIVQDTLRELATYTVSHFQAEEELMRKSNYPGLAAHQAEHQRFVAKVRQLSEDVQAGRHVSIDLVNFVRDWLPQHIQRTDRSYSAHMNAQGVQ